MCQADNANTRTRPLLSLCGMLIFRCVVLLTILIVLQSLARALAAPAQSLAQRTLPPTPAGQTPAIPVSGNSPLPQSQSSAVVLSPNVSGSYAFDHNNESIEIDIHHGKLKGYIARLGDAETDKGTPLTYFFDHTSIHDNQLQFATKVVHGLWYSFAGTILRGDVQERDEEGYYVLTGQLQVHHPSSGDGKSSNEIVEQRTVHYKSLAQ